MRNNTTNNNMPTLQKRNRSRNRTGRVETIMKEEPTIYNKVKSKITWAIVGFLIGTIFGLVVSQQYCGGWA